MHTPSVGRIVEYKLSEQDADRIIAMANRPLPDGRSPLHNPTRPGDVLPAITVRAWDNGHINAHVLLDGELTLWVTSVHEGTEPGTWSWPASTDTGRAPRPEPRPAIGRIVHYVSYGTPGGEYGKECRAAVITQLAGDPDHPNQVGLAVLNPTGQFFNRAVDYHDGGEQPGPLDCPDLMAHGSPFRYCACGWAEASYVGGTWHWPERTDA